MFVGTTSPGKTRAAVIAELIEAKRSPVSADGWLDVGGEAGAVYVGVSGDMRNLANLRAPSRADIGQTSEGLSRSAHRSGKSADTHTYR